MADRCSVPSPHTLAGSMDGKLLRSTQVMSRRQLGGISRGKLAREADTTIAKVYRIEVKGGTQAELRSLDEALDRLLGSTPMRKEVFDQLEDAAAAAAEHAEAMNGVYMKTRREAAGVSRKQLADQSGITEAKIARIELKGGTQAEYDALDQALTKMKAPGMKPTEIKQPAPNYPEPIPELKSFPRMGDENLWDSLERSNTAYLDEAYTVNCDKVVHSYEMRRRGYDVSAQGGSADRSWDQIVSSWEKTNRGAARTQSFKGVKTAEEFEALVAGDPVGSRYICGAKWKDGGSHVFVAERTPTGVRFMDPQMNRGNVRRYFEETRKGKGQGVQGLRVDNLAMPDESVLQSLVQDGPARKAL